MIKKKKTLISQEIPEFKTSVERLPEDSRIFIEKSVDIASYVFQLMEKQDLRQKDLAEKMGKSEAEVSKWLGGLHNYTLRSLAKLEAALGQPVIMVHKVPLYKVPYSTSKTVSIEGNEVKADYENERKPLQLAIIGNVGNKANSHCINSDENKNVEVA